MSAALTIASLPSITDVAESVRRYQGLVSEVACSATGDRAVSCSRRDPDHCPVRARGEGIGQTGDPVAQTRLMRTAPLWGARFNTQYLHDGRPSTITDAILAHDGQGAAARVAFRALGPTAQDFLVRFVLSL